MRIGVDVDGVLTIDVAGWDYENRKPNLAMISWVNQKFEEGHYIELFSARLKSDKKVTKEWLKKYGVKYNNLILGKPRFEMYIDDIAYRPEEVCSGQSI
jgi:uncharacterized HAD superfamily protein